MRRHIQVLALCSLALAMATGCEAWAILLTPIEIPPYMDPNGDMDPMMEDIAPTRITLVVESPDELTLSEDGTARTFWVELSARPPGTIVVPVSISGEGRATVSETSLMFNDLTWATPQRVEVAGVDDMMKGADEELVLTIGPGLSQGTEIAGLDPVTVRLTLVDGVCGNGVVDGREPCEPGGEEEPCVYGMETCAPTCTEACEELPRESPGFCGDGVLQAEHEECEGAYAEAPACTDLELGYGTYACDVETCQNDTSECRAVKKIVAGHKHTCALFESGDVKCWGGNMRGQLGNFPVPGPIPSLSCYRENSSPPLQPLRIGAVSDIYAGAFSTCAIVADQSLWCWGYNSSGQVGEERESNVCFGLPLMLNPENGEVTPAQTLAAPIPMSLALGGEYVCGVAPMTRTDVLCMGQTTIEVPNRELTTAVTFPTPVDILATAENYACGLLQGGTLHCWGFVFNESPATYVPREMSGWSDISQLSLGSRHLCALDAQGIARCQGNNSEGQLGVGDFLEHEAPMPVNFDMRTTTTALFAGMAHTCAIIQDGRIMCWGKNSEGQLGLGDPLARSEPTLVPGIEGVTQLALGAEHTCTLFQDKTVRCWGSNAENQLGDGALDIRMGPSEVEGL
jgi:alpha-tubulin suppressor-like RCC1 family protein